MPRQIVFTDSIELLAHVDRIEHRFIPLDNDELAVKTTLVFAEHEFHVTTKSHAPHTKNHTAMASNINEALDQVEIAVREGKIVNLGRTDISFAEKEVEED